MKTIIVYSLTLLPRNSDEYVFKNIDQLFKMAKELSKPNTTMIISTYRMSEYKYEEMMELEG